MFLCVSQIYLQCIRVPVHVYDLDFTNVSIHNISTILEDNIFIENLCKWDKGAIA